MSESSGASFPGFGSEEIRNLPATETVTAPVEQPQTTRIQASTEHAEVLSRQASPVGPPLGDSHPVQSSMIRELIREELRRGLGRRSRRSEREGPPAGSLSSHCPLRVSTRHRSSAPSRLFSDRSRDWRSFNVFDSSVISYVSGDQTPSPPRLTFQPPEGPPAFVARRTLPSATVSRAPSSPFVTPVMQLPPSYAARPSSAPLAPPRQLLPLFPSFTPPPRYEPPSYSAPLFGVPSSFAPLP